MNNVKIEVNTSSEKFITYLINNNIEYKKLERENHKYTLITSYENYKKINRRYSTKLIRYYGKNFIKYTIINNKYLIISFLICFFFLYLLTNTTYKIEVNCNNESLKTKLIQELNKYEIKKYKRIKKYSEIEKIKEEILNNLKEVEWLEISTKGTKYIIDVNEKLFDIEENENGKGSIIAKKDGVIKHIVVHEGEKIKEENEYVKKGEVIISGNIYKGEELVKETKAKGEVYAEVWYLAKVNIPLIYKEEIISEKVINHYYIQTKNKKISLIGQYNKDNLKKENKCILDKPYLPFKIYKETIREYIEKEIKLTNEEAIQKGMELLQKNIENTLKSNEYIISKNILKKNLKSSKMYIEVFFKVYEDIADTSIEKEKEQRDEERNS